MSNPVVPAVFDTYLAMWNEPDHDALLGYIVESCSDDVIFADPNEYTVGRDDLVAMAVAVKTGLPGANYRRVSGVDVQNRRYRYLWEIEFEGEVIVQGMDIATLNEAGQIERIDGFFTPAPPALD